MAVRQNALDSVHTYPQATQRVLDSFYVGDGLSGADSKERSAASTKTATPAIFQAPGLHFGSGKRTNPTFWST